MPVPEGKYKPLTEAQINEIKISDLKSELMDIENQCIRPLLEIHYLQEQGKDIAKEKAFLNQRYAEILLKRAQLQGLIEN